MADLQGIINRKVKQFESDLLNTLNECADDFSGILRDSADDNIYGQPSSYDRSMNMLSSVTSNVVKKSNNFIVEAYNEPSLMTDRHESWDTNEDMREAIPNFMEFGNGNSSIYSYEGRHYVEDAQKEVNKYTKILKRKLKSKGYTIK